jgi:hypothetical protein
MRSTIPPDTDSRHGQAERGGGDEERRRGGRRREVAGGVREDRLRGVELRERSGPGVEQGDEQTSLVEPFSAGTGAHAWCRLAPVILLELRPAGSASDP